MTLRQESGRSDGRMEDEEEIAPLLYPIQNLPPLTLVSRRFRLLWSTSADNPANSGAQRLGRQRRSVKDQGGWRYGRELQEFWRVKHAALELFGSGARIRMWVFNLKELNPLLDDTTCETREDDTLMHYKSQTMGIGGFEVEAGMILQSNDLSRMVGGYVVLNLILHCLTPDVGSAHAL